MCINIYIYMYIYYNARQPPVRKVDVRLPGQGNGARPVHLIITMMRWIRTSRLSIKKSPSPGEHTSPCSEEGLVWLCVSVCLCVCACGWSICACVSVSVSVSMFVSVCASGCLCLWERDVHSHQHICWFLLGLGLRGRVGV
jgi:hypothetical protein